MLPAISHSNSDIYRALPQQNYVADKKAAASESGDKSAAAETQTKESLTADEQRQIRALKARDLEVRAHEQGHLSAAGGFALSGASFSYQTGPDGIRYAIGGEVKIDTSAVRGDPEATIRKAETIQRAALAPASPSSQDYSVASKAARMANEARVELLKQKQQPGDNELNGNTLGSLIDIRI